MGGSGSGSGAGIGDDDDDDDDDDAGDPCGDDGDRHGNVGTVKW